MRCWFAHSRCPGNALAAPSPTRCHRGEWSRSGRRSLQSRARGPGRRCRRTDAAVSGASRLGPPTPRRRPGSAPARSFGRPSRRSPSTQLLPSFPPPSFPPASGGAPPPALRQAQSRSGSDRMAGAGSQIEWAGPGCFCAWGQGVLGAEWLEGARQMVFCNAGSVASVRAERGGVHAAGESRTRTCKFPPF